MRDGNAVWKSGLLLLAIVFASSVLARAATILAWDAPVNSPVRVDGFRVYRDGVLIGEPTAANLSWPIDVSDGQPHTFGVSSIHRDDGTSLDVESDAATVTYTPSSSGISDTVPPSVALSVNQNGGSPNYQATGTANDNVSVERIELSLDTSLFATCYASPCSATVSIKSRGSHVITAVAWDVAGNKAATASSVQR